MKKRFTLVPVWPYRLLQQLLIQYLPTYLYSTYLLNDTLFVLWISTIVTVVIYRSIYLNLYILSILFAYAPLSVNKYIDATIPLKKGYFFISNRFLIVHCIKLYCIFSFYISIFIFMTKIKFKWIVLRHVKHYSNVVRLGSCRDCVICRPLGKGLVNLMIRRNRIFLVKRR